MTVTVPVYNSSEFIDDCLDNLLKQTCKDFELIFVVDSRTSDNSVEILRSRIDQFSKMRIVEQTNGKGLAGARNIGIEEASGNVIWFLDVDDIPYPTFLEELLKIMSKTNADTVVCNHYQTFERKLYQIPEKDYSYTIVDGSYAVSHYTDYPIYSWSRIQKKTVFNEESMFRQHLAAEDIEQTIRQYASSKTVCYYNKPLYTYVKRKTSSTRKNRDKEIRSLEETAESLLPFVKDRVPEDFDEFEKRIIQNIMRQLTFSDYRSYSKGYDNSIVRLILSEIKEKTTEMKVFLFSKMLYYVILFPFSHCLWDRKKGLWGS